MYAFFSNSSQKDEIEESEHQNTEPASQVRINKVAVCRQFIESHFCQSFEIYFHLFFQFNKTYSYFQQITSS